MLIVLSFVNLMSCMQIKIVKKKKLYHGVFPIDREEDSVTCLPFSTFQIVSKTLRANVSFSFQRDVALRENMLRGPRNES